MIYSPREDSFMLEEEARKLALGQRILDMGSASGIIAEAALDSGAESVLCADIQDDVVAYLRKKGFNAIKSDLFSEINEKFGLICFNPPYLPFDSREDSESSVVTSGGGRGDELIVRFLSEAGNYINNEGIILIVLSSLTPRERILDILRERKFNFEIISRKKVFMEELEVWKIRKV